MHKGELVEVVAQVLKVGRSSMDVDVELFAADLPSGERRLCTRGRFVMIAVDGYRQPKVVSRPAQA